MYLFDTPLCKTVQIMGLRTVDSKSGQLPSKPRHTAVSQCK